MESTVDDWGAQPSQLQQAIASRLIGVWPQSGDRRNAPSGVVHARHRSEVPGEFVEFIRPVPGKAEEHRDLVIAGNLGMRWWWQTEPQSPGVTAARRDAEQVQ